ncbi:hypothetical protein GPJ81_13935 [Pseudomonas alkylphenolica]|uniref:Uncharacterized protein n=1 Tax=Pseudomonas alkylphenolica TaxID=237609 RepID=A0A6I6H6I0_9PSED|nr:hypothetical protein [Pseudomonas alkylphenolica]QGW77741.1 hypothetical protein GPJ81_13935 [Pseudomonas alkylphenolica]
MKDSTSAMATAELLMEQALDALRRYNEAKGHASPEEVERLGLRAVSLMAEAQEYQLRLFGGPIHPHG